MKRIPPKIFLFCGHCISFRLFFWNTDDLLKNIEDSSVTLSSFDIENCCSSGSDSDECDNLVKRQDMSVRSTGNCFEVSHGENTVLNNLLCTFYNVVWKGLNTGQEQLTSMPTVFK